MASDFTSSTVEPLVPALQNNLLLTVHVAVAIVAYGGFAVAFAAAALASGTDLRSFRVPNWISLPLVVSGSLYHGLTGEVGS